MKINAPSESALAVKYGCTPRTIRRWKRDNAPLGDAQAMTKWLSSRRTLPADTGVLLSKRRTRAAKAATVTTAPENEGAAFALRRLEKAEAAAYRQFQAATTTGDAISVKSSRENWLRISEQLRAYDLAVESTRRECGDLVERKVLIKLAEGLGVHLRTGFNAAMHSIAASDALWHASLPERFKLLDDVLRNMRSNVIATVRAGWWGEHHFDEWLVNPLAEGLLGDCMDTKQLGRIEEFRRLMQTGTEQFLAEKKA